MQTVIKGISSMATRQLLTEMAAAFERQSGCGVSFESVGGVDAVKRLQGAEVFDLAVLASDAIDKLIAAGHIRAGSKVDLVRSGVAVAVRAGAALPDISSEDAVRLAVRAVRSVSYSTGPSGVALAKLFERWGIADEIQSRLVQAPPGVPVATLVASGQVGLGFQQLSELMHVEGVTVVGPLPPAIQITTTFSAGIPTRASADSSRAEQVRALLEFITSPQAEEAKRQQGMEPA